MESCIFCKIIAGELPSSKVYEDEHVIAFLDIHPVTSGHTLVVPKIHCDDLLGCDFTVASQMMNAAQKVGAAVMKATGTAGFNLGVNNGATAGQVIFHLHMHVIPRSTADGLHLWPAKEYQDGEMKEIAQRIKDHL